MSGKSKIEVIIPKQSRGVGATNSNYNNQKKLTPAKLEYLIRLGVVAILIFFILVIFAINMLKG